MVIAGGDLFAPVADLPGVAAAAEAARAAVDRLLRHRVLRRDSARVSVEAALRSARASAALDGAAYDLADIRSGSVTDPVVAGAVRVSAGLGALAAPFQRAPMQALARLHVLAAGGLLEADALGRPALDDAAARRLAALPTVVTARTTAPAVVVAAVVHGELLTVLPFAAANGVVARAAARLALIGRGLDPKACCVPEIGHLEAGVGYTDAASAYATGDPAGVAGWIRHCCEAVVRGAQEGLAMCEAIGRGVA